MDEMIYVQGIRRSTIHHLIMVACNYSVVVVTHEIILTSVVVIIEHVASIVVLGTWLLIGHSQITSCGRCYSSH